MREFLVAYEFGTGAVYAMVRAYNAESIVAAAPDVVVYPEPPKWLHDDELSSIRSRGAIDLDDTIVDEMLEARKTPDMAAHA